MSHHASRPLYKYKQYAPRLRAVSHFLENPWGRTQIKSACERQCGEPLVVRVSQGGLFARLPTRAQLAACGVAAHTSCCRPYRRLDSRERRKSSLHARTLVCYVFYPTDFRSKENTRITPRYSKTLCWMEVLSKKKIKILNFVSLEMYHKIVLLASKGHLRLRAICRNRWKLCSHTTMQ